MERIIIDPGYGREKRTDGDAGTSNRCTGLAASVRLGMLCPSETVAAADEPDIDAIRILRKNDLAETRDGGESRSRPLRQ